MGIGIGIGIGGGRSRREDGLARVIATLFRASEPGFLSFADPETCFTETAGTINAQVGQAVAYWKDLSGRNNHATQPTTANRPILGRKPVGGRRNLLTFTEQFDNAFWNAFSARTVVANAATAPDGTITADEVIANTDNPNNGAFQNTVSVPLNGSISFYAKQASVSWVACGSAASAFNAWFNLAAGTVGNSANCTASIQDVGDGWFRCVLANVTATNSRFLISPKPSGGSGDPWANVTNAIGDSVFLWGAQLELSSTATAYQRVVTAFDVTEAGKPDRHYLFFGGTSDPRWMQTPTIAPGTDKAQVFAGIRKLSDAARGTVIELTASSATNNGALHLTAPNTASATFGFESKGTTLQDAVGSGFTAPVSAVLTGLGNIAGDSAILRVNGAVADTETGDQGTGNYTEAAVFIGRRNGTDNALNGEISSLTIRFGPNLTTEQIELLEQFTASKVSEPTI
jgi:hypothetical protein